jgi:translation initiation factor IF-2
MNPKTQPTTPPVKEEQQPTTRELELPPTITVKQLAELMGVSPIDLIKQLMRQGVMAAINQAIDFQVAELVVPAFGFQAKRQPLPSVSIPSLRGLEEEDVSKLVPRPPVVTILGHVDHGKTTLLDAIRKSQVAQKEVGGITQHIGAYQVEYKGERITFLDTPGHEAFTAMRARGAQVTDIAILVVAADDGVMPQTVEAINHAKAAGVPIIVAINKIDKPQADVERVKRQLGDLGLVLEEWGGDVIAVPVSAKQAQGIEDLLENILVVAEVSELRANPDRPAAGVVIEARLDKSRGPVATVLVQNGTLKVGDCIVAGGAYGKVKAMFNDAGRRVKTAPPSTPVEVLGLGTLPEAGDIFSVYPDERTARNIAERRMKEREAQRAAVKALTLEEVYSRISAGEVKELNLILKADVQGSLEAIAGALNRLATDKAKVRILHAASGSITESDVLLAKASKAIILGFNTSPGPGVERLAEREGVEVRLYSVIYHLTEDVEKALKGILEPVYEEVVEGHAEVKAVFPVGKLGKVAGCLVTDGRLHRGASVRILRKGQVIFEGTITSLRRFKQDVTEVATGFECGVGIQGFTDFQPGDILEVHRRERVPG